MFSVHGSLCVTLLVSIVLAIHLILHDKNVKSKLKNYFDLKVYTDTLLSHGVKPTWGFHKVKLRKSDLATRSWLPTLERGRGSSWEPRD
jgi:hypothetical protein